MCSSIPQFRKLWSLLAPSPPLTALPDSLTVYRTTFVAKLSDTAPSKAGSSRLKILVPKNRNTTRLWSSFLPKPGPNKQWQSTTATEPSVNELEPRQLLTNWTPTSRPHTSFLPLPFLRRLQCLKLLRRPTRIPLLNLQNNL